MSDSQQNLSNIESTKVKSPPSKYSLNIGKGIHPNPWVSGSFYLVVFVVVVVVFLVVGRMLPLYALPTIIVGGILALAVIGALQLRGVEQLSQENFLKLMGLSFRFLPLLRRREDKAEKGKK